jgi:hypothetical protein
MIFLNAPLEILNKKITPSDKLFCLLYVSLYKGII